MINQPIIYTDLDGTLLDHYSYDFSAAIPAIEQLASLNIPVIANTSKTFAELVNIQQTLGLNCPFICENGAAVYIPKGYFELQPETTEEKGYYWVKTFSPAREHWLDLLANQAAEFKNYYVGFSAMTVESLCSVTDLTPTKAKLALLREHTEPLLWLGNDLVKQQFTAKLQSLGAEILQGGRFLHVGGKTNKAHAMNWLTHLYQQKIQQKSPQKVVQTIALGDSGNDVAMLNAADIAVQIKSPVHDFPALETSALVIQSNQFGPKGWAEALQALLFDEPSLTNNNSSLDSTSRTSNVLNA
ncbi:HAD-IIB family hydrolase [Shewanella maritima]|uniref:HAD-IIB family hydrolase n=1 Tax=Shewanella maritima TaxID=2520507 RepID=UPI0037370977